MLNYINLILIVSSYWKWHIVRWLTIRCKSDIRNHIIQCMANRENHRSSRNILNCFSRFVELYNSGSTFLHRIESLSLFLFFLCFCFSSIDCDCNFAVNQNRFFFCKTTNNLYLNWNFFIKSNKNYFFCDWLILLFISQSINERCNGWIYNMLPVVK